MNSASSPLPLDNIQAESWAISKALIFFRWIFLKKRNLKTKRREESFQLSLQLNSRLHSWELRYASGSFFISFSVLLLFWGKVIIEEKTVLKRAQCISFGFFLFFSILILFFRRISFQSKLSLDRGRKKRNEKIASLESVFGRKINLERQKQKLF